jgi:hypothetical protein
MWYLAKFGYSFFGMMVTLATSQNWPPKTRKEKKRKEKK